MPVEFTLGFNRLDIFRVLKIKLVNGTVVTFTMVMFRPHVLHTRSVIQSSPSHHSVQLPWDVTFGIPQDVRLARDSNNMSTGEPTRTNRESPAPQKAPILLR